MLNSSIVVHTAHQLLYAHRTEAYEEEGNGFSLDMRKHSKLFGGKKCRVYVQNTKRLAGTIITIKQHFRTKHNKYISPKLYVQQLKQNFITHLSS
jgi:hypothetical protein